MFAKRIVAIRQQKSLTQDSLAEILGVTRSAVSLWEIGKREPDIEMLKKIALKFNVTVDWLVGRVDSPTDSLVTTTTEPLAPSVERMNDPASDEINDLVALMSPEEREAFRRLAQSVVNRQTKGVS